MDSPDKVNYDLPFKCVCITENSDYKDSKGVVVGIRKIAIRWADITYIEEYPEAYEQLIDWKEWAHKSKCWICFNDTSTLALIDFEEIIPYWEYYLKNVVLVDDFQTPNFLRRK